MENHEYSEIIGNASLPYENYLASSYALATDYYSVTHPSLPNYLALTAGTTFGLAKDCVPSACSRPKTTRNIADVITGAALTWKEYAESMPSPCYQGTTTKYVPRHDPFVYYGDITGNSGKGTVSSYCKSHVVPLGNVAKKTGAFFSDLSHNRLPNYTFITPNICDDDHNCASSSGDKWLSKFVPTIIKSKEFASTVIFIVWDEGTTNLDVNGGTNGGGHVACIVVGPSTLVNYGQDNTAYDHYSLLRTVEDIFGQYGKIGTNDTTGNVMGPIIPSI
jgi:phospholipase C